MMIDYWKALLIVAILPYFGVGADDTIRTQRNLRGLPRSRSDSPTMRALEEMSSDEHMMELRIANSRERKEDLFRARSNDFDDDVIKAYESSNDAPPLHVANMAPSRASTPTDSFSLNVSSSVNSDEPIFTGVFHQAPSRPSDPILSAVEQQQLTSTPVTPTNHPSTTQTSKAENGTDIMHSYVLSSSPDYTDNTVIIARYHQEDIIAEANVNEQLGVDDETSERLLPPAHSQVELEDSSTPSKKKSKQIVPALLTGFASMILFFALFLICSNQREQYIQRKWEREQIRRAALFDDGSCGRSARSSQACSEPFEDVYGEAIEDGRSLYSRGSAKGGEGSEAGGSYWVRAVVKKMADRKREEDVKLKQTNILPPMEGGEDNLDDDDETSFAGLSLVSSLTQSLMTFGSALWPSEEASLDLGPSSRRVAAQSKRSSIASSEKESLDGEDSAIAHLRQTNSNEDAGGSVCSSLTDGTATTLKSADYEEAPVGESGGNGNCMPSINEDGVHDEENRRMSLFSPSTRKDVSTDSTQTPSTVLDDSSLDLASELARLQNLIGKIDPGDDFCYERDMVFKSLSDESFDLGRAEGREEI